MVIITTMVAKIYFPASLERGQIGPVTRSYSYRMVEDAVEEHVDYGSDASDDEENDELLDSESSEDEAVVRRGPDMIKNLMEFDQERMSQAQVLKRLIFCSLMLNITFVAWGAIQVSQSD